MDLPDLRARFCQVRSRTEALAAPLGPEDQTVQSMPDVSPTKWHRAHTSWFFEEFVLGRVAPDQPPHHPQYRYLFNSYYEAVGQRHPRAERGLLSRPSVDDIAAYRRDVDSRMMALLDDARPADVLSLVELGLHHEQQHQELLLMDAKHVLSQGPLDPVYLPTEALADVAARPSETPGWRAHEGGIAEIGHDGRGFAFDNEGPRHQVLLAPFEIADHPVTAGEWLAFIADDGYRRPELWLSEGWATVQAEGWEAPLYWRHDDEWTVFTLHGRRSVDPSEPVVHVSYFEADAFARWAGARLPTEAEWEVTAVAVGADRVDVSAGDVGPLHPASGFDVASSYGSVWEWTASPYTPYPGFTPAAGAVGEYNGKFMVNQQVLRGGCCVTPPDHARPTYRNFFPAGARWAFAGLRLARDAS